MIVQELPQEIIVEILLRLPVKSLIRFKCVSKSWSFLISSSSFTRWHLNHVNDSSNNSIIVCSGRDLKLHSIVEDSKEDIVVESRKIDIPMFREIRFLIKCCCDGMLCLAIEDNSNTLVLWNPSIRVNKILPLPPSKPSLVLWMQVFGFGYDRSIKDYKVVSLPRTRRDSFHASCSYQVHVLTLRTNSWRKIGDFPYFMNSIKAAIPVNGGLYWGPGRDLDSLNLILRFDLAHETFSEVAMPPIEGIDGYVLGHMKGSLCMYVNFALWVMKEESELWSKMMIFIPRQTYSHYFLPLCFTFTKSGKVFLADFVQDKVVIYDSKGEIGKKPDIHGLGRLLNQNCTFYTESLISPESVCGMKDIEKIEIEIIDAIY